MKPLWLDPIDPSDHSRVYNTDTFTKMASSSPAKEASIHVEEKLVTKERPATEENPLNTSTSNADKPSVYLRMAL